MRKLICLHDENSRIRAEIASTASNTRALATVKGKYVHLDWLSGTFDRNVVADLIALVEEFFPERNIKMDAKPSMGYHMARQFQDGVLVSMTADYGRCHVAFSGNALSILEPVSQFQLMRRLDNLGMKATRIDIALDDYDRELSLEWHSEQISLRGTLCYFRTAKLIRSLTNNQDETLYLGRRGSSGSGVFMRIYDKYIESEGEVNAIRYECEFSGDKVGNVFNMLLGINPEDSVTQEQTLSGLVLGSIDYREKDGKKSLDRCRRVSEWEAFLAGNITLRVKPRPRKPNDGFNVEHFTKQWARSLVSFELAQPDNLPNLLFAIREHAASVGVKKIGARLIGSLPKWAVSG